MLDGHGELEVVNETLEKELKDAKKKLNALVEVLDEMVESYGQFVEMVKALKGGGQIENRIVILVTEDDFKRFNPKIEADEMNVHAYAEKLMENIEQHLYGLPNRYHTAVCIEGGE